MKRAFALVLLVSACSGRVECGSCCKAFVTCSEATGTVKGSLDSTFGSQGSCWTTTTQAAEDCERACITGLSELQQKFPDAGCK